VSRPISWRVAGLLLLSCARPTRAVQFPIPLFEGVAKAALYCAHGTSTVSSCAFCEQEGHLAAPSPSLQAFSLPLKDSAAWLIPYCARRTTVIYLYYPSNLARTPFTRGGPIGLPLRATFSPAHPLARRDAPIARARVLRGRALREHRSSPSCPLTGSRNRFMVDDGKTDLVTMSEHRALHLRGELRERRRERQSR
jgi:hypothetical protein